MSLSARKLAADPDFFPIVMSCIDALLEVYNENARIASIFASQQRWLMAHLGLALYYGLPGENGTGLYSGRFIRACAKYDIASRNTAASFLQEMQAYRFLRLVESNDARTRNLEPTEVATTYLGHWLRTHVSIADHITGKSRVERILGDAAAFAAIEAKIAELILTSKTIRKVSPTFDLFNDANAGGAVMDYLMSRLADKDISAKRIPIGRLSLSKICDQFLISNTNLKRLLKQSKEIGSTGWMPEPDKNELWLARSFVDEYLRYQAEKIVIVDTAANHVFARFWPDSARQRQARRSPLALS
ncbi:hypothetical protein [Oryzifoliimicrobium ureilyticus]|uniref:hypothetical protein n=1 Tax=Oryzifoliimicrobium ureilyticus TaxID=3113724 RepID=UPI003076289F